MFHEALEEEETDVKQKFEMPGNDISLPTIPSEQIRSKVAR